jgi:hypothetical protein
VPEDITLPCPGGPVPYRLYAAVIHLGAAAVYGHYYSYCRESGTVEGPHLSGWRLCSDSMVEAVTQEAVTSALTDGGSATPYMMLYRRMDTSGVSAGHAGGAGGPGRAGAVPRPGSDCDIDLTGEDEGHHGVGAAASLLPSPSAGPSSSVGPPQAVFVLDRALHQHVAALNADYLRGKERGEGEVGVGAGRPAPPAPPRGFGGGGGGPPRRYRPNLGFGSGRAVF